MKKITFIFLTLFVSFTMKAQTETYFIDWSFNSTPTAAGDANSSRTIEVGDTVTWIWYASGVHNVSSEPNATESFESEFLGQGSEFSHTFTQEGVNDYVCTPHSFNMFGTITVVPEGTLSTNEFLTIEDLKVYPNPTSDVLNINLDSKLIDILNISVFNTLGQKVKQIDMEESNRNIQLNITDLEGGLYILKVNTKESSVSKRFIIE